MEAGPSGRGIEAAELLLCPGRISGKRAHRRGFAAPARLRRMAQALERSREINHLTLRKLRNTIPQIAGLGRKVMAAIKGFTTTVTVRLRVVADNEAEGRPMFGDIMAAIGKVAGAEVTADAARAAAIAIVEG